MSEKTVVMEKRGRVCILTLNAPKTLNAMDDQMAKDFEEVVSQIMRDPDPRVVVVTGAGRAFSAGANLDMMLERMAADPVSNKEHIFTFYRRFLSIMELKIPSIAAINGHAVGAGAGLIMACDIRLAAENCKIGLPFAKMGLHPGMGAEYFLPRIIGRARTFELLMTGETVTAEEAYRIGLVNHLASPEELMSRAMELAEKIAAMPVRPIRMLKESIDAAIQSNLTDSVRRETLYQALCFNSDDLKEGVNAVREKRAPQFKDEY